MSILSFGKKPVVEPVENLTALAAKRCLDMPEFKEYREQFEAMEAKIIDEMIMDAAGFPTQPDSIERFGAKCLIKLTRIRDLRSLLSKVNADARRSNEQA